MNIYTIVLFILVLIISLVGALVVGESLYAARRVTGRGENDVADEGYSGGGPFRLRVSDPEYTALLNGQKTVEARLDRPPFNSLTVGETVVVIRSRPKGDDSEYPGGKYKHDSVIKRITKYNSISDLLTKEGHSKVYPKSTEAEAKTRFSMYLPPGTSDTAPVIAIELSVGGDGRKKLK